MTKDMMKDPRWIEGSKILNKARQERSSTESRVTNFYELERALQKAAILEHCHTTVATEGYDEDSLLNMTGNFPDAYGEMLWESTEEARLQVLDICVKMANLKVELDLSRERETKAQEDWSELIKKLEEEASND